MIKENQNQKYWWSAGIGIFAKLSAWIVFPVILAVVIGKKLDMVFETDPWLLLVSVGVAFILSIWGMIVTSLKEFKRIDLEKNNYVSKSGTNK